MILFALQHKLTIFDHSAVKRQIQNQLSEVFEVSFVKVETMYNK
jgi:ribosomal protein L23